MLALSPATRMYVVAGATDMRMSYNGLSALVEHELRHDPLTGHIYIFCNRRRDRIKVLVWDGSGLWVCAKRLEKGTFAWPQRGRASIEMTHQEVALLLGGIDLKETEKRRWYQKRDMDRANEKKALENLQSLLPSS